MSPPVSDGGSPPPAASEPPKSPSQPKDDEPSKPKDDVEDGEVEDTGAPAPSIDGAPSLYKEDLANSPLLPAEPLPAGPPLPQEAPPQAADDGWDCQWDPSSQSWFFYNRFTGKTQWDNPRVPSSTPAAAPGTDPSSAPARLPPPPTAEKPAVGGYNPAIHGDYDPNAWYAQEYQDSSQVDSSADTTLPFTQAADPYASTAQFNRFTGQFQTEEMGAGRHTDEAKSRRQMNAFFDVDAAANSHDGRSLKAERSGKKLSKNELKAFKEKRKARKEEKRRAWLRD